MFDSKLNETLEQLSSEQDALKSSIALNRILHSLLIQSKKEKLILVIVILFLILLMFLEGVGMLIHESQMEQVEEETKTVLTYSEASGENSAINNVQGDQYNDQAVKNNYREDESQWQQDK